MDYAIIGGGPAGLCFALYAARAGYRCTLYEAEELGGCHSVHSHWREHGPRVYSRSYVNFAKVLHDVGTTWNNEFQDYAFQISQIGANSGATLSLREMAQLAWYLQYPEMPVAQALHDFTPASRDYIERLCRLVDGASAQRMPMRTLAGLVNQESVNALAQPRRSMNLLWARWARVLHKYGVRIVRRRITDISNVQARRIVLAMPPQAYCSIAGVPQPNAAWLQATSYNRYYSYTFAWHERVLTQQQRTAWGFAATRNGLVYIILSDYLQDVRGELISVALTRPTTRPDVDTALQELRETLGEFPDPDRMENGPDYPAWIHSAGTHRIVPHIEKNIYTIGTHTYSGSYAFTTLESATCAALEFAHTQGIAAPSISQPVQLTDFLVLLIFILLVLIAATYNMINYTESFT